MKPLRLFTILATLALVLCATFPGSASAQGLPASTLSPSVAPRAPVGPEAPAGCTHPEATCIPDGNYTLIYIETGTGSCTWTMNVDWGDGLRNTYTSTDGFTVPHHYANPGVYTGSATGFGVPDPGTGSCTFTPSTWTVEVPATGAENQIPPETVANPKQPETNGSGINTSNPAPSPTGSFKEGVSSCPASGSFGDPCNAFDGNFFFTATDLTVAGLLPIQIERAYYSGKNTFVGEFGVGSHLVRYNYRLTLPKDATGKPVLTPGTQVQLDTGNGSLIVFSNGPSGGPVFTNNAELGTTGDTLTLTTNTEGLLSGVVYTNLQKEKLSFDANGYLMHSADRNGNGLDLMRDASGKLLSITELSTGRQVHFSYNSDGLIASVSDTSRTASYAYSPAKELQTVTNVSGASLTYTWNADHRIVSQTDYNGTTRLTNEYGPTGAVVKQTQADGGVFTLEAPAALERKVTDPNDHVTNYKFNDQGLMVEVTDALDQTSKTNYSSSLFSDQATGRFIETQDPLNRTVRVEMNGNNLPTRIIDPLGQRTNINYDAQHPERPKTITDPKGHTITFSYDAAGNLIAVKDNAGNLSKFTYNGQGQVLTATDPMGQMTALAYDSQHQLITLTDPLKHTTRFSYDKFGRLVQITNPKKGSLKLSYDALDRLVSLTNALGQTTRYAYDANRNLISVTDAKDHTTSRAYDSKDRLVSVTNPKGESYRYVYDAADLLTSATDPKSQMTDYTYDAANRLTGISFGDGTHYSYSYDAASQLLTIADGTSQWGYSYDLLGRVTVSTSPQGTLNYSYDANSKLTQLASPSYGPVNYAYDNLDRLISITKGGTTYGYSYNPLGKRTQLSRPNGVLSTYEYDADSRLAALTHSQGTSVLERHEYGYDVNGNITKYIRGKGTMRPIVTKPVGKGFIKQIVGYVRDKAEEIERTYTYDPLDRLAQVSGVGIVASASQFKSPADRLAASALVTLAKQTTNPQARETLLRNAEKLGAVMPESATWTFDANGNIVSKTARKPGGGTETRTMTYDQADRLVSITKPSGTVMLSYDANGNRVSDSTGRAFTWNALDQLTSLQTPSLAASFAYDPLGRRTSFSSGSTSKSYFYTGLDMLSDGTSTFLQGAGIDEPLQMDNSAASLSYLQDHLGSTSQLLNASAQVAARYDYKSYGKLEGDIANPSLANPFTYTGREDDGTGLYYYRARYYEPELELFISRDPVGDDRGNTLYTYVSNNPQAFTDPNGLQVVTVTVTTSPFTLIGLEPWWVRIFRQPTSPGSQHGPSPRPRGAPLNPFDPPSPTLAEQIRSYWKSLKGKPQRGGGKVDEDACHPPPAQKKSPCSCYGTICVGDCTFES